MTAQDLGSYSLIQGKHCKNLSPVEPSILILLNTVALATI